ncbi:MAG: hypothetical protein ACFNYD_04600, partial [Bacteroides sp.]
MGKRYVIGSRFFRGLLILLLVLPAPRWALGQFYPVHATVHLLPPLGPYLSDLSAPRRDRVAITLLKTIVGLVRPDSGEVWLHGDNITDT